MILWDHASPRQAPKKRAVEYGLRHRMQPLVRRIGIDEVSRRKGQVYLTVVYDLERRVLLTRLWDDQGLPTLR